MADQTDEIDRILGEILPEDDRSSESESTNNEEAFTNEENTSSSHESLDDPVAPTDLTLEYMRFESPTYHLTYRGVAKTFCGRDLLGVEYKSTTNEPELLDPCDLCERVNNQLTEEEKLEQIREEIGNKVDAVSESHDEPSRFQKDELAALIDQIPTTVKGSSRTLSDVRTQLSLAIEKIDSPDSDPGKFTINEVRALKEALQGEGIIPDDKHIYLYTKNGVVKKIKLDEYRTQQRGGKGNNCYQLEQDDQFESAFITTSRKTLFLIDDEGHIHETKANKIPRMNKDRDEQIYQFLEINPEQTIQAAIPADNVPEEGFLIMVTKNGYIKRTPSSDFKNIHRGGIRAIELEEDDKVCDVLWSDGTCDIVLGTNNGRAIRFGEKDLRPMGREARGVSGIKLEPDDYVVSMTTIQPEGNEYILTITANGFGKRTNQSEYRKQNRNGVGLKDIVTDDRNGNVVHLESILDEDQLIVVSTDGNLIRMNADDISSVGRNTKGVIVMEIDGQNSVATVAINERI